MTSSLKNLEKRGLNPGNKLSRRQQMFVAEYLASNDATKSARNAGYSPKSAMAIGCQLLKNRKVAAEISRKTITHLERLEVTAENVLAELAKVGFANMLDYVRIGDDGSADVDLSSITRDQAAAIEQITIDATGGSGDGERRKVLRTRFKLGDKRGSLELLGKHFKLFTDKSEITGLDEKPLVPTEFKICFVDPNGAEFSREEFLEKHRAEDSKSAGQ